MQKLYSCEEDIEHWENYIFMWRKSDRVAQWHLLVATSSIQHRRAMEEIRSFCRPPKSWYGSVICSDLYLFEEKSSDHLHCIKMKPVSGDFKPWGWISSQEQQRKRTKGSRTPSTRQQSINDLLVCYQQLPLVFFTWQQLPKYSNTRICQTRLFQRGKRKRKNKFSNGVHQLLRKLHRGFQANAYQVQNNIW